MRAKKIGIIGSSRGFGKSVYGFFAKKGFPITGSYIGSPITNKEVVEDSDVVIFAVPIGVTVQVIDEMLPYSRESQLLMDVTTYKVSAVNTMLKSSADVIGLHPLFGPTEADTWRGQKIAVHMARVRAWSGWALDFLKATEARVELVDPAVHDFYMLGAQGLPQLLNAFVQAKVILALGFDTKQLLKLATRFSRKSFGLIGRILQQKNHRLYADIQIEHPGTTHMIKECIAALREVQVMVDRKDQLGLISWIEELDKQLGPDFVAEAAKLFNENS